MANNSVSNYDTAYNSNSPPSIKERRTRGKKSSKARLIRSSSALPAKVLANPKIAHHILRHTFEPVYKSRYGWGYPNTDKGLRHIVENKYKKYREATTSDFSNHRSLVTRIESHVTLYIEKLISADDKPVDFERALKRSMTIQLDQRAHRSNNRSIQKHLLALVSHLRTPLNNFDMWVLHGKGKSSNSPAYSSNTANYYTAYNSENSNSAKQRRTERRTRGKSNAPIVRSSSAAPAEVFSIPNLGSMILEHALKGTYEGNNAKTAYQRIMLGNAANLRTSWDNGMQILVQRVSKYIRSLIRFDNKTSLAFKKALSHLIRINLSFPSSLGGKRNNIRNVSERMNYAALVSHLNFTNNERKMLTKGMMPGYRLVRLSRNSRPHLVKVSLTKHKDHPYTKKVFTQFQPRGLMDVPQKFD
jgi:hypothetical protein